MEEIATVYARSLFEVAKEHDSLDDVREQIGEFADALNENHELSVFFFSPYFSTEEKKDGLGRVLDGADETVLNFIELLVEKHRVPAIHRIRRELDSLWREENKLLPVTITSALELDGSTVKQIGETIGQSTGREIQITTVVEPDIIGGLVVRVGNQILDASIRNRLDLLRRQVAKS
jgi:F-type H+-transporting ATPase subunit delta